jgi:ABC-type sugar transport system, permease component
MQMNKIDRNSPGYRVFTAAAYLVAFLWLIPLLWVLRTAFAPENSAVNIGSFFLPTLENFNSVLTSVPFPQYFLNTVIIVAGTLAVQIFFITLAAYAFARLRFFGKNALFTLFLTQLLITPDVLIFPTFQLMGKLGATNTLIGIMLPFFASGMGIFLMRQSIKTLPVELEEAAFVEGCPVFKVIWKIYFPLLRPAYTAFALISISYHWNDFLWPLVMINSTGNRPLTLGLAMVAQTYETGAQWGNICAATLIVICPLMVAFLIFQKQFIESFAQSGIK